MADEPNSQGATTADTNTQGDPKNVSRIPAPPINKAPPVEEAKPLEPILTDAQKETAAKSAEAQAVADAAKAEAAKPKDEPKDDGEYITMEDASGQAVINMLKEAGVTRVEADAIFKDGLTSKDPSKVNWDLLAAKLGPDKTALAKVGIEKFYQDQIVKVDATVTKAHEIVGGAENWNTIAAWVKVAEAADASRKPVFNSIRAAIEKGGYVAELAVKDLKAQYDADPKTNGLGTTKIIEGNQNPSRGQGEPLTRTEYYKLRTEAERKGAKQPEINALQARRRAGMAAGI